MTRSDGPQIVVCLIPSDWFEADLRKSKWGLLVVVASSPHHRPSPHATNFSPLASFRLGDIPRDSTKSANRALVKALFEDLKCLYIKCF